MANLTGMQPGKADIKKLFWAWTVLAVMGATWGLGISLSRIAATRGAHPLGIAFWECSIAGLLLLGLIAYRRIPLPLTAPLARLHFATGLLGMVIPGAAFFYSAVHVPAGILAITVGLVPILTFVASALVGIEKLAVGRLLGVVLGTLAVALLVAPEGSLPDPAQLPWVLLSVVSAISYAILNVVIALRAPPGMNSLALVCGMFVAATVVMIPILYATGGFAPFGWPWGIVEWCFVGLGLVNAVAFVLYFTLIEKAGPVFSSFTANMVTLFGVLWGIIIFGEQNSVWVWLSFATVMVALAMVAPRERSSANG